MSSVSEHLGQFAEMPMLKNQFPNQPIWWHMVSFFRSCDHFHLWNLFTALSSLEGSQTWNIGPPKGHRRVLKFVCLDTSMTGSAMGIPTAHASGQHWPILSRMLLEVYRIVIQLKSVWKASPRYVWGCCKNSLSFLSSYQFIVFRRFWISYHSL